MLPIDQVKKEAFALCNKMFVAIVGAHEQMRVETAKVQATHTKHDITPHGVMVISPPEGTSGHMACVLLLGPDAGRVSNLIYDQFMAAIEDAAKKADIASGRSN